MLDPKQVKAMKKSILFQMKSTLKYFYNDFEEFIEILDPNHMASEKTKKSQPKGKAKKLGRPKKVAD